MDNKHQAFWLIPRVPPLWRTKLQIFLSVSSCISGAIEKPAKIKQLQTEQAPTLLHHSYQILTNKVPKFPDLPLATEPLGSYRHFHGTWITCPLQKGLQATVILKIKTTTPWAFCLSIDLSLVNDPFLTFSPFLKCGLLQTSLFWSPVLVGRGWQSLCPTHSATDWNSMGLWLDGIFPFSGSPWIF